MAWSTLRAISKAMKNPGTDEPKYLPAWKSFFHGVMALYRLREVLSEKEFVSKRQSMEQWPSGLR